MRWTIGAAILGLALLGGAALGLRLYLGRAAEDRLRPAEIIDFSSRGSAGRDNVFAICPAGFCEPPGDCTSPIFAVPWARLRDTWRDAIAAEPRITEVSAGTADPHRLTYVQRSAMLRFHDIITVEFVALGEERSAIAVDSRSRYGRGDLGVNRRRVMRWIALLEQAAAQDGAAELGATGASSECR